MSDGVDVVVTLHALATYAESANHWTDDKRMMDASGVADTIYEAMDRIEELEAKLAKAVDVLGYYALNDDGGSIARNTLAELSSVSCANTTGYKESK